LARSATCLPERLCIVLVKVARMPEYWIPLMVGVGLRVFSLLRRFIRRNREGALLVRVPPFS